MRKSQNKLNKNCLISKINLIFIHVFPYRTLNELVITVVASVNHRKVREDLKVNLVE